MGNVCNIVKCLAVSSVNTDHTPWLLAANSLYTAYYLADIRPWVLTSDNRGILLTRNVGRLATDGSFSLTGSLSSLGHCVTISLSLSLVTNNSSLDVTGVSVPGDCVGQTGGVQLPLGSVSRS